MNKKATTKISLMILFAISFIFYYSILVSAAHNVTVYSGGVLFSVNESTNSRYNITVRNTDLGWYNITAVDVYYNSTYFTFIDNSNGTNASSSNFANTTGNFNWTNSTPSLVGNMTSNASNFAFNLTSSTPGIYYLNVTLVNYTGTTSTTNFTITVNDTTAPTATLGTNPVEANISSSSTVVFDAKCSDNNNLTNGALQIWANDTGAWAAKSINASPTNSTWYNVSVDSLAQNKSIWAIRCNDTAGNLGWSGNRTITIDTAAPTYTNLSNSTNSTYAGEYIKHTLNWSDNFNLSGYIFSFDNGNGTFLSDTVTGNWTSMTGTSNQCIVNKTINSTVGSTIRWRVYTNDSAGNLNLSGIYSYITTDGTVPTVTLSSPVDVYNTSSASTTFNCSATDNINLSNITLYTNYSGSWLSNGTSTVNGTSNSTGFLSRVLTANNKTLWNCYACDNSSNCAWASSNYTVTIDTTKPSPRLVEPTDDEIEDTTVTFKYNVTDNYGIYNCSLYIDDDFMQSDTIVANGEDSISFDSETLTGTSAGRNYNWYVNCSDYAGNANVSATWTVKVKTTSSGSGGGGGEEERTTAQNFSASNLTGKTKTMSGLIKGDKVNFTLFNASHLITVKTITSTSATLEIASTPVTSTLSVNETKTFDLNGNNMTDFSVKLVNISGSTINLLLKAVTEVPTNATGNNNVTGGNLTGPGTGNKPTISFTWLTNKVGKLAVWLWIILAVVVIVIAIVGISLAVKTKKKGYWWKK